MILRPTTLDGAWLIDLERHEDERGFFARTFDRQLFVDHGLDPAVQECSIAYNHVAGTVRGMHLQRPPATETKLVRCTSGAILDVIVDVRESSPTYLHSYSVELSADNRLALYVPGLFAHGYQTLTDRTEISYQISAPYTPSSAHGLRHDDPALGLSWPRPVTVVSDRDRAWPLLDEDRPVGAAVEAAR